MEQSQIKQYTKPFRHWIIKNFVTNTDALLEALKTEKFNRKSCELFQFYQGQDLSLTKNIVLKKFYTFFSSASFLEEIGTLTHKKIKKVDMSPFIYADTDYLLPHDDGTEGRLIAYIVYLNTLQKKEGGSLDFFEGKEIVKSVQPQKRNLVMFEVTPQSIHQVREILTTERISFAGRFRG